MEDAPKLLKIPKSECLHIWIRLPRHKWPKSWSSMEDPVVLLERKLYDHPLAGLLQQRPIQKILLEHGWEKVPNWECLFLHRQKRLFFSVYVDDITLAGKKKISIRCGKYSTNRSIWANQHHSLITYTWDLLKYIAKHANLLLAIAEQCSNPEFPQDQRKNYQAWRLRIFLRGPTTWKVMPRSVWNVSANGRTKLLNNCKRYHIHGLMTTNSKKN